MFSFIVGVHNENESYITKCLSNIVNAMDNSDELIICDDYSDNEETLKTLDKYRNNKQITIIQHHLNNDFSAHRNYSISKAKGDFIFWFDADEYIDTNDIKEIKKTVIALDVDAYLLSRANYINGLTPEYVKQNKLKVDQYARVNYPDWQTRIWKNKPEMKFSGKVHEQLIGFNSYKYINANIIHKKDLDRQIKQNDFYKQIINMPEKLNIIWRICDASGKPSSSNNRDFNVSKTNMIINNFKQLLNNINNLRPDMEVDLYCIHDKCSDLLLNFIKNAYSKTKFIEVPNDGGNALSFCTCVNEAAKLPDDEIVFFLEDDYLLLNNNILCTMILSCQYLSHKYRTYIGINPQEDFSYYNTDWSKIEINRFGHFIDSHVKKTTCTFVTYTNVIKRFYYELMNFSYWPKFGEEVSVNKMWENIKLFQPIPTWTIHEDLEKYIPPYLDMKLLKNIVEYDNTVDLVDYDKILTLYKQPFELIRVGREQDGGYVIPKELITKNLFSAGIDNEISFELDYIDRLKECNVHCYDGTIDKFPSNDERLHWHKLNIDANDNENTISINTIFDKEFNNNEDIFVKMDIESYEYSGFSTLSNENLKRINCLTLEVHDINTKIDDFLKLMKFLNTELVLVHKHINEYGGFFKSKDKIYGKVYELTFINKKYIHELVVNDVKLPIEGLDYKNSIS